MLSVLDLIMVSSAEMYLVLSALRVLQDFN